MALLRLLLRLPVRVWLLHANFAEGAHEAAALGVARGLALSLGGVLALKTHARAHTHNCQLVATGMRHYCAILSTRVWYTWGALDARRALAPSNKRVSEQLVA